MKTKTPTKICIKCKKEKPLTASYFFRNRAMKDGFTKYCKPCTVAYNTQYKRKKRQLLKSDADISTKVQKNRITAPMIPPKPVSKPKEKPDFVKTKNHTKLMKFYRGAFLEGYRNLEALGLNESVVATIFGVGDDKLRRYTSEDKAGQEAYQAAMAKLQSKLAQMMLVKAIGYDYQEERIEYKPVENENKDEEKQWEPVKRTVMLKHHPGNSELMVFYLTNRYPDLWKVSKELITQKKEMYDADPAQRDRKKIEALARDVIEANTDEPERERNLPPKVAQLLGDFEQASQK